MQRPQEDNKLSARSHALRLDNRENLALTGVTDVESYDETSVYAQTTAGRVVITGRGLKISKLNLEEGQLAVDGQLDSFTYTEKNARRGKLVSRIFK